MNNDDNNRKWRREQIFEGDADVYGVAYKFKKSKINFRKKRKIIFPLLFVFFFIAICAMASGVVANIVVVNGGTNANTLKMDKVNYYAVSAGSYSGIELASEIAGKLKLLGGAGYVYNHNGEYCVLLYAYANREDALNVCEKIKGQGFENASIVTFECDVKNYSYKLSEDDSQIFLSCISAFSGIYQSLYAISNKYDNKLATISACRLELVNLQKDFERNYQKFIATFSSMGDDAEIVKLIKKLDIISSELDILVDPLMLDSNFASLIKHSCINLVIARFEL